MVGRIYTDTSVIGGCEDEEFRVHSRRLMDAFVRGDLRLVLSELTLRELAPAPLAVREVLATVPEGSIEVVRLTPAADELARRYLAEGILKPNMLADAQHIAMATVANVDALVSWNFRHVVNLLRIHGYHAVNIRLGYPAIEIRSPREVLVDE
ncbi:MAG: PIN domain protein [Acidobacteria bacterium RIFCSPLOWO2_02_FULL_67_36]|nr:MAG: PIN domain protein [Acidobacteria bacterium RIFCSPLOWO2_02_FULL_67_36]